MITTLGKQQIISYIAGLSPSIGQSLAVGIRSTTPSSADTSMGFEVARVPITSVSLDPKTNVVTFKGTLEDAGGYTVNEVGLWSSGGDSLDSSLILTFDEMTEGWDAGTDEIDVSESTVSRIGDSMMNIAVSGATAKTITYEVETTDLTGMLGPDDTWSLALNKVAASTLTVKLKINSLEGSLELNFFPSDTSATGYMFSSVKIKDATVTGSFDPSAVEGYALTVQPTSTNQTNGSVQLDGIVANNSPAEREGSVLVARDVVSPAFKTSLTGGTDVEYKLGVSL